MRAKNITDLNVSVVPQKVDDNNSEISKCNLKSHCMVSLKFSMDIICVQIDLSDVGTDGLELVKI